MTDHEPVLAWNKRDPSELKKGSWIKIEGRLVQVEDVRKADGGYEIDWVEP